MIHISDLIPKFYMRPRLEDPTAHAVCTGPGKSLAIKECLAQLRARGIPAIVYDYDWQQVEEKYGAGVAHRMRANLRFAALGDL